MTKILAITGHRSDKLGGYAAYDRHRAIRRHMRDFLLAELGKDKNLTLLSGGALGIDQFWIQVGLFLEIPVIAALPFKGYDSRWPEPYRLEYQNLLDKCHEVMYLYDGYAKSAYQYRNEYLVDNSDLLVAYWNGSDGGTANCLKYAKRKKHEILVFNPDSI